MAEEKLLGPGLVIQEIDNFIDSIYELGEIKDDQREVSVQHILKKYKGKPDAAAKVIFNTLGLFGNAIKIIKQLKKEKASLQKENNSLKTAKSVSDIAEKTGQNILKYVSDKFNENSASLNNSVEQFKSYAEALQTTTSEVTKSVEEINIKQAVTEAINNNPPASMRTIKSTVRDIFRDSQDEADRSKNLIFFGVEVDPDNGDECTFAVIESLLEDIGENVVVQHAERFGKENDGKPQPIRATFKDKFIVHDILKSAKKLKATEDHKNVYISIHRTMEQQKRHKDLVDKLKKKIEENPERYWYIKSDKIFSREKIV